MDQKEAISNLQKDLMNRYYEHGGTGAYVELENPKESLRNTTIEFRVIGRQDNGAFGNYARYYSRLHGARAKYGISNRIATATASFRYPKPSQ